VQAEKEKGGGKSRGIGPEEHTLGGGFRSRGVDRLQNGPREMGDTPRERESGTGILSPNRLGVSLLSGERENGGKKGVQKGLGRTQR